MPDGRVWVFGDFVVQLTTTNVTTTTWTATTAPPAPEPTVEEQALNVVTYEQAQRNWLEDQLASAERYRVAEARARQLLHDVLDEKQRACYAANGWFFVKVGSEGIGLGARTFVVVRGYSGNIYELDLMGFPIRGFCIHLAMHAPYEDHMVAQKLTLETDVGAFMRTAYPAPYPREMRFVA